MLFQILGQLAQSAEVRLLNDVLGVNRQDVRPVKNATDTIMITVDMVLTQIVDLVRKNSLQE